MESSEAIILPTSYFPPIQYFKHLTKHANIYVEQLEYYKRHSIRNRAWILGANGKILLTVPIVRKHYAKTVIKNIKIANNNWQKKHINSIQSAYGSSPFFIHYFDAIKNIINKKHEFLIDLNTDIMNYFIQELDIIVQIQNTTQYVEEYPAIILDQRKGVELENKLPEYHQVFDTNFQANLSIIDLIFNLGPNAKEYIHLSS